MDNFAKTIKLVNIEDELKNSYLDYAMSVIIGRALPDVRDGLKPVHRRILYAMYILGNIWNKPYKKSARIVGDVIGKYHPHGDTAVYDAIVRLAQTFSLRYTLIDGQGNFGSIDGDPAAAMRYTEIKMTKISQEIISDLEKETVNYILNYDGTENIPIIMPTKIPNLLINGSSGIAVGMTTNIPPHNITEVINACLAYINDVNINISELMQYISGPDFPTAGIINGTEGIKNAYHTGKGQIYIRGRSKILAHEKYNIIIIYELPYQINKAKLIEKIVELIKIKKIIGIKTLRDESDKDGIRIVIHVKKDISTNMILNNLYKFTSLESSFHINMVALHKGKPTIMSLKDIIVAFINHRREIVMRRTIYEIKKYNRKAHILEGLIIALINIKDIIQIIRSTTRTETIKTILHKQTWYTKDILSILHIQHNKNIFLKNKNIVKNTKYSFSNKQVQAILDLKLHKLTNLEYQKLCDQYQQIILSITKLSQIMNNNECLMNVICKELISIKEIFGDTRKTEIISKTNSFKTIDFITSENVIVILTHKGYIKYQKLSEYNVQHRGGKGKLSTKINVDDYIIKLSIVNTHDNIMLFSNFGRLYWLKVYNLPSANRYSKGRPLINILPLKHNEYITTFTVVNQYSKDFNLFIVTMKGFVKATNLQYFSKPRSNGIIAIKLYQHDYIKEVAVVNFKDQHIMLFSYLGKAVRFCFSHIRSMGRNTKGVRGIKFISNQDKIVSLIILENNDRHDILTITENGYGKRTHNSEYPLRSRATKGVINIKTNYRNGKVVGTLKVLETDHIIIITNIGTLIRIPVSEICLVRRNTIGVTMIKIKKLEKVIGLYNIINI
ncbi:DNA gyrase subunit A [Enterobacteriaceae endosymbiont of Macroplea appendiculata]|uniref:DNA gyrase subunit A n=1 Tax=Enterobacteriaceae endosymbiont of Macroplea appendiculata TaxID=2675790 RepID=UPI001448B9E7|nr:DNA gyrase subunit A [Enterobacteriaceae endosymbiont of Macroplea appendiculata]QJC30759.1 DNA gyrase subunit A [Enterobacteriaceae endosymbiont of Macroplea appendiculata]